MVEIRADNVDNGCLSFRGHGWAAASSVEPENKH
jgi:hypothetical protein